MKPTRQYNAGDAHPSSARYIAVTSVPTTGILAHSIYLTQQQQPISTFHPSFSPVSGSSPHSSRDYHPHHGAIHGVDISGHRTHLVHTGSLMPTSHTSMPITQHRRPSGHRVSLLRDIGIAGERERDRTESSVGSLLPHAFSTVSSTQSHLISSPMIYGSRPNISMLSSMVGLQATPNMVVGSLPLQGVVSTSPRHNQAQPGQNSRTAPSAGMHQYSAGSAAFLSSAQSSIKSEPGVFSTYVKEEPPTKSPLHSVTQTHYPQLLQQHPFATHQLQQSASLSTKIEQQVEKESESRPAKEELLHAMDKVDKEITKVQSEMARLERKRQQLETVAKKPPQAEKPASPKKVEPKHRDLWQVIYAENKKKAEAARAMLHHLGQRYDMPLYNQPCDTRVYQDNLKKNEEMRPKLLAYFQRRSQLSNIRERYLCARYDQLMTEWQKRTEKIENNIKRKAKEAKVREFFEKLFPEIRKQREQQERFSRSGTRGDTCRSEADFNEIVDGLSEQEHHEQHMRQLAVVPPMLLDRDERRLKFINNNGLVSDPFEDYKKRQELDNWSPQEKQIFKEKYIQHPKNFHVIASYLDKKYVADCVLFYYLSKKSVGYKGLVRKNTLKPRKPKSGRTHQATATSAGQDIGKTGHMLSEKSLLEKDSEQKKDSPDALLKEEEVERIERPPSPRMTRSRNKNLNWTDEDVITAKEGFVKHGKDFTAISRLFQNKTEHQVKSFYHNYKKKHNLDQLIADGKKKKSNEGSRRTRTHVQTSESNTSVPTDEDMLLSVEEKRPKSAEPQISSSEMVETSKKRKKDNDEDKKEFEEVKNVDTVETSKNIMKTTDSDTTTVMTPRVTTPVTGTTLTYIRTRRSAAAANNGNDSGRSESAKRTTDRSPVDEPAEKKIRKSKKPEPKVENKELSMMVGSEKKKNEVESTPGELHTKMDESTNKEKKEDDTSLVKVSAAAESDKQVIHTSDVTEVAHSTSAATASSDILDSPSVTGVTSAISAVSCVAEPLKSTPSTTSSGLLMNLRQSPHLHLKLQTENDGDSSATCSADEEPNMQDVTSDVNKSSERKHVNSPYAFEEDSSASIKLESMRVQHQPITAAITSMSIQLPLVTTMVTASGILHPVRDGRPSSTHAPPQFLMRPQLDEKRPQSLPPPPVSLSGTNVPIGSVRFHIPPVQKHEPGGDIRPNSTPMFGPGYYPSSCIASVSSQPISNMPFHGPPSRLHIIGKVPAPSEFRSALQGDIGITSPHTGVITSTAMKTISSIGHSEPGKISQTIDLTMPQTSLQDAGKKLALDKHQGPRPHYHPVPAAASSLLKDLTGPKVESKAREEMKISRPRHYTTTDFNSMRDRAAVIPCGPIPVSSLRFPVTSSSLQTSSSGEIGRNIPSTRDKSGQTSRKSETGRHLTGTQLGLYGMPSPMTIIQPSVATSSIQTKFVSGSMTSGVPVFQKQLTKQPDTPMTMIMEGFRPDLKSFPVDSMRGLLYPMNPLLESNRPPTSLTTHLDDPKAMETIKKFSPSSKASIVKGTSFPEDGTAGGPRRTPGLDDPGARNKSPSTSVKGYMGPGPQVSKIATGSIMTGVPAHRAFEVRPEQRVRTAVDIIPGREILVRTPYRQSPPLIADRTTMEQNPQMLSQYPRFPSSLHHPGLPTSSSSKPEFQGLRGPPPTGSILAGTPVKRKASEESNSSLSPSKTSTFPGSVVSRHSPTSVKQPHDRKAPHGSNPSLVENMWSQHQAYQYMAEVAKKEEMFHGTRHTPDKIVREATPRSTTSSPGHRRTPTGLLSQHPSVKQEVPSSPRSGEDSSRRHQRSLPMVDPQFATPSPDMIRQMQLVALNYNMGLQATANPEMLDILRQYGGAPPQAYPLYFPGYHPGLTRGIGPSGSPVAPRSPHTGGDEGMENTKKMLSQDFRTAQLMQQRSLPPGVSTAITGPLRLGFPAAAHLMNNPALSGTHLVVSGSSAYPHPLGPVYHPGALPEPLIPQHSIVASPSIRSPYSPQYHPTSSRSSTTRSPIPISPNENSRSPIQRPTKPMSPEFPRQRHRSGDLSRELPMSYGLKERNSPASPLSYHSPRGNTSPRDRNAPLSSAAYHQLSSLHPSQRVLPQSMKSQYHYPPSSTPPARVSPHPMPVGAYHPSHLALNTLVETASKASRALDSSPYAPHHLRSGSLDAGNPTRQDTMRPDSAGPHARSLPQSPNTPPTHDNIKQLQSQDIKQESRYTSKPPQADRKGCSGTSGTGRDVMNLPVKQEESAFISHQNRNSNSPKPVSKIPVSAVSGMIQTEGRHLPLPMTNVPPSGASGQAGQWQRSPIPLTTQQNIIHGVPTYSKEGPVIASKPPHPKPADLTTVKSQVQEIPHEQSERHQKKMSKNPGEDLKKSGRAQMTAANLIEAIININYHSHQPEARTPQVSKEGQGRYSKSPHPTPSTSVQQTAHTKQSSIMAQGNEDKPILGQSGAIKQSSSGQSQGRYESEQNTGPPTTTGATQMPFNSFRQLMPGTGLMPSQVRPSAAEPDSVRTSHSSPITNRTLSFAEHSADVINECYRGSKPPSGNTSPMSSPNLSRSNSGNMLTEPISPPQGRIASNKTEVGKKQQPVYLQQQFHQQLPTHRFPLSSPPSQAKEHAATTGAPRLMAPVQEQIPGPVTIPPNMNPANPVPNSSLEDIIRKALLQNNSGSSVQIADLHHSQEQNILGDAFIHHAIMSTRMPTPQTQPVKSKPAPQQPQSGAGAYMSALMLRQMQTNTLPQVSSSPAQPAETQHQYYGGTAAPRTTHAQQSGTVQPPDQQGEGGNQQQQRHKPPAMLPQYESLSDSD